MSDSTNEVSEDSGPGHGPEEAKARFTEAASEAKWVVGSDMYRALHDTLAVAVPLWILRYQQRGGPGLADFKRVASYNDELGRADVLLFGGKHKPGEIASFFNHMAEAMAVLSFCPQGIDLFGLSYESAPSPAPKQGHEM